MNTFLHHDAGCERTTNEFTAQCVRRKLTRQSVKEADNATPQSDSCVPDTCHRALGVFTI